MGHRYSSYIENLSLGDPSQRGLECTEKLYLQKFESRSHVDRLDTGSRQFGKQECVLLHSHKSRLQVAPQLRPERLWGPG
jgi:hypothetical protein